MALIGLTGYARVGKDTFAEGMKNHYGYTPKGFADPIYGMALALNPILFRWGFIPFRYRRMVRRKGLTEAKRIPAVRRYLQKLGTEAVRQCLGEDVFVDAMFRRNSIDNLIITNCRFTNEAEAIRSRGGIIVKIERPGFERVNGHESEDGLPDHLIDLVIDNDGDPDDMDFEVVHDLANQHRDEWEEAPASSTLAMTREKLEAKSEDLRRLTNIACILLKKTGPISIGNDEIELAYGDQIIARGDGNELLVKCENRNV